MIAVSIWHLGIAYILVACAAALFAWCLCVIAGRSDEEIDRLNREQEREARDRLYGGGGWRAR